MTRYRLNVHGTPLLRDGFRHDFHVFESPNLAYIQRKAANYRDDGFDVHTWVESSIEIPWTACWYQNLNNRRRPYEG
jgi:hypothetical protein